jgi:hypothetical protein
MHAHARAHTVGRTSTSSLRCGPSRCSSAAPTCCGCSRVCSPPTLPPSRRRAPARPRAHTLLSIERHERLRPALPRPSVRYHSVRASQSGHGFRRGWDRWFGCALQLRHLTVVLRGATAKDGCRVSALLGADGRPIALAGTPRRNGLHRGATAAHRVATAVQPSAPQCNRRRPHRCSAAMATHRPDRLPMGTHRPRLPMGTVRPSPRAQVVGTASTLSTVRAAGLYGHARCRYCRGGSARSRSASRRSVAAGAVRVVTTKAFALALLEQRLIANTTRIEQAGAPAAPATQGIAALVRRGRVATRGAAVAGTDRRSSRPGAKTHCAVYYVVPCRNASYDAAPGCHASRPVAVATSRTTLQRVEPCCNTSCPVATVPGYPRILAVLTTYSWSRAGAYGALVQYGSAVPVVAA